MQATLAAGASKPAKRRLFDARNASTALPSGWTSRSEARGIGRLAAISTAEAMASSIRQSEQQLCADRRRKHLQYVPQGHRGDGCVQSGDRDQAGGLYLCKSELRRPKADLAGPRADIDAALELDSKFAGAIAAKADLQADGGELAGAIATYTAALTETAKHPICWSGGGSPKPELTRQPRGGDRSRQAAACRW